jgi:hypothetical protein
VFFSTIISVLYYLGWMQVVIRKVAWVMQTAMGTTAGESLNAAGNIFIGQVRKAWIFTVSSIPGSRSYMTFPPLREKLPLSAGQIGVRLHILCLLFCN